MCGTEKVERTTEWDERVSPPAPSLGNLTKLVSAAADKCSSALEKKKKKQLGGGRIQIRQRRERESAGLILHYNKPHRGEMRHCRRGWKRNLIFGRQLSAGNMKYTWKAGGGRHPSETTHVEMMPSFPGGTSHGKKRLGRRACEAILSVEEPAVAAGQTGGMIVLGAARGRWRSVPSDLPPPTSRRRPGHPCMQSSQHALLIRPTRTATYWKTRNVKSMGGVLACLPLCPQARSHCLLTCLWRCRRR